ncbi:hypothetical protein I316_00461 [Kwoniella heveanensis BCC8398]|uniref:GPI-anchored wall transfer protein 1 n=1 Tax=Kwoniella heveanensis BCC8398 TaxID=1296120 RepID=A0A1B9H4P1_9TREE|nr:hypothetical protein I316_00461 [Kwoniella heveanensis BCC8398]
MSNYDYKTAKEAFHADNAGSSISTILSTSYALYAFAAPRFRPSFTLDYLTSALPLLLSVTTFSNSPYTLNLTVVVLSIFAFIISPSASGSGSNTRRRYGGGKAVKKSAGSWLDESDSDEEPSQPPSAPTSSKNTPIKLPSQQQVAFTSATAHALSPSSSSSTPTTPSLNSPSSLSVDDPFNNASVAGTMNRRRITPQPSPEAHMVDILPTPPFPETSTMSTTSSAYPSRTNRGRQISNTGSADGDDENGKKDRLPFLSIYRAHMMLLTSICILAVDFPVFPRWLGKCESFGTSLMDVGVGSFVFSLGLISVKSLSPLHQNVERPAPFLLSEVLRALRKSAPTLALGLVRVIMVKGTEYPEHVTEYGVHWNFFFTIGLLPIFGVLVRPLRAWIHWSLLGSGISLAQQLVLSYSHLQDFLLSPARPGLLGANKEGLASLPGYISIYLVGLATGEHIIRLTEPLPPPSSASASISISQGGDIDRVIGGGGADEQYDRRREQHYAKRRTELVLELFGYSVAWWTALVGWRWMGGEVSRRFANTPYVLFIAAYNTLFLLGYLILETYLPQHPTPPLLEAINKNGLLVFLLANLGTGLVNVSVETMYVGDGVAVMILGAYTVGVCGVAWVLRGRRIKV